MLLIRQLNQNYWIVDNTLPDCLNDDILLDTIRLLSPYIASCRNSDEVRPTIIRVVPQSQSEMFPKGTEGFAGLTGEVATICRPVLNSELTGRQVCSIWETTPRNLSTRDLTFIVVAEQASPQETLGFLIHELVHTLGGVDGLRCPANPDYNPNLQMDNDLCDCYWWYGVTGVFTAVPDGVIHHALNNTCESSDDPATCESFVEIMSRVDWAVCDP